MGGMFTIPSHGTFIAAEVPASHGDFGTVPVLRSNPPARDPLELETERMHVLSQVRVEFRLKKWWSPKLTQTYPN
jgi:hypothetical protein